MTEMKLPLPIYESWKIGKLQGKDGTTFEMHVGLSRALVEQLKRYSLDESDENLQNNTSDKKRFGEGSYEEWYSKERTPYALVSTDGNLAALAWFGPKPLGRKSLKYLSANELLDELSQPKSNWHTIVYRSYRPFRGKGLMVPFMQAAIADYKARYPHARLWAGVSQKNLASLKLAEKLGFKISKEHIDLDARWAAMTQE